MVTIRQDVCLLGETKPSSSLQDIALFELEFNPSSFCESLVDVANGSDHADIQHYSQQADKPICGDQLYGIRLEVKAQC